MTHARLTNGMRALLAALLALVALAATFSPAVGQQTGGDNIRVALVADGQPVAGKTWTLALHFVPKAAEWHGYWKNPGDAGAGMRLAWTLPKGWQAGELQYPVPKVLEIAGLANHVFAGEYAVLVPVTVPANADPAHAPPIELTVDYLACTDQICVPERADLTLDPAAAVRDPRFDRWRAAIAPLLDRPVRYAIGGRALRMAIPLPAALKVNDPHVFIEPKDLVNYAAHQSFTREGDWLIAEVPLAGTVVTTNPVTGIVALGDGNGVRFRGEPGVVPPAGTPLEPAATAAPVLWIALVGALLGGLLLNIMPCVFPILSLKALALAKAGGEEKQARRDALAYTAGVVMACLALGAIMLALRAGGEQVGWAFQLQEPGVVAALLVLAVAITASFLGAFELPSLAIAGGGSSGGRFVPDGTARRFRRHALHRALHGCGAGCRAAAPRAGGATSVRRAGAGTGAAVPASWLHPRATPDIAATWRMDGHFQADHGDPDGADGARARLAGVAAGRAGLPDRRGCACRDRHRAAAHVVGIARHPLDPSGGLARRARRGYDCAADRPARPLRPVLGARGSGSARRQTLQRGGAGRSTRGRQTGVRVVHRRLVPDLQGQ